MAQKSHLIFFCLTLAQDAHSIEEYVTKLYEVFAPARSLAAVCAIYRTTIA